MPRPSESFALPTNADWLLDTSAALALVLRSHKQHEVVLEHAADRTLGLAGHAVFETFSVLTRLPGVQRVSPMTAVRIIRTNFPASYALSAEGTVAAPEALAAAGIAGGAVYDGLVALAAREARAGLLTCDRRALPTYERLDGLAVTIV
jgi:predicted nucleic acid-binding protein